MTPEQIKQFVTPASEMTAEEIETELNNLIEWEGMTGTAEPRIDELTIEILMRELMVSSDWIDGWIEGENDREEDN